MLLPPDATVRDAPALHALLRDAGDDAAALDCRQLARCDAAGLQLLVALRAALAERGHRLALTDVPTDLQWRFAAVGLDDAIVTDRTASA